MSTQTAPLGSGAAPAAHIPDQQHGGGQPWPLAGKPAAPAVSAAEGTWSFRDLGLLTDEIRTRMRDAGLGVGDRLVLDAPAGTSSWVLGLLAGLAAGGQIILADPAWSAPERQRLLARLKPRLGVRGAGLEIRPLARPGPLAAPGGGPGVWLHTSGTTRWPRPCFRSLAALQRMVELLRLRLPAMLCRSRLRCLALAPMNHGYGLMNSLLLILALGGAVVLAQRRSTPEALVAQIIRERIDVLYGWPGHFAGLAEAGLWRAPGRASLRWCVASSSPLARATAVAFARASGCPVRQQYGTTELGPLCLDGDQQPSPLAGCLGMPLPGIEVQALGPEGRPLPPGGEGRLHAMVRDPVLRAELGLGPAARDTGDIGSVDGRGRVFLHRRALPFSDERAGL